MQYDDWRSYPVLTCRDGVVTRQDDMVVVEHELALYLNGQRFVSLLCTPRSLCELVVGFLHAEGIIQRASDILSLCIDSGGGQAHIQVRNLAADLSRPNRVIATTGGHGVQLLKTHATCEGNDPVTSTMCLDPAFLCRQMETFGRMSDLFQQTGGAHSCALSDGSDIVLFEDDIGRHNALDKVIGHTLRKNMAIDDKIILTSGRVSSEIVAKVIRAGIKVIVSRSAPTGRAIDMARSADMTLIGFVRGKSLNVYTNFSCVKDGF